MSHEFEIREEVTLRATPEQVWEAIATGPGLATWFMPMPIEPEGEGTEVWEPGHRLLIRTPAAADGSTQAFEYLIETAGGGTTVLRFAHSGFLDGDWSDEFDAMTRAGWAMYLATLAAYFEHFAGRPATYVEADGPASSADADAWSALLASLSPTGPVALDQPVTIAVGEADHPITATVDYLTDHFVGLRTADALIRFHGRSLIDLPIAVSHHAYADIDAGRVTQGWIEWLAAACASSRA